MARNVPGTLAARLTIGSTLGLIGAALVVAAQVMGWILIPITDVAGLWEWNGEVATTNGSVIAMHATRIHVNRRPIFEVDFEYDGRRATSYSSVTGPLHEGERLAVEYPAGRPEHARIVGMRRAPIPPWSLAIIAVPALAALVLLPIAVRGGLRSIALLRDGTLGTGELVERRATRMRVNGRKVYRLEYEVHALDGRRARVVVRTHRPMEDRAQAIVYDPETLRAVVPAALPGSPRLSSDMDSIAHSGAALGVVGVAVLAAGVGGWIGLVATMC